MTVKRLISKRQATKRRAVLVCAAFAVFALSASQAQACLSLLSPWSGAHFGGGLGATYSDVDMTDAVVTAANNRNEFSLDDENVVGFVQAGFDITCGNLVFGVAADATLLGHDHSADFGTLSYRAEAEWVATLRGRAGFSVLNALVYGTAGVAFTDVSVAVADITGATRVEETSDDLLTGYVYGAGVEVAVLPAVTVNLDVQQYLFDTTFDYTRLSGGPSRIAADVNFTTVRLGVSLRLK
ncbi:MAG: outer membrane beta-barrel protein [Pseudomonadota bacterium]